MNSITVELADFAKTFTMISRPDTHYFMRHELPAYMSSLAKTGVIRFRNYITRVRSGEYIPKDSYSDAETNYVYLTVGQFSKKYATYEGLTFLEESVGKTHASIHVNKGDIVITRSGTVGVAHIFSPPDSKVYIPSHHLAVVEIPDDTRHSAEYLRLILQSDFPRRYFWAFATGKDQKEISNWSIKSLPIPQCENPQLVASQCLEIEDEIKAIQDALTAKEKEKERVLYDAIKKQGPLAGRSHKARSR